MVDIGVTNSGVVVWRERTTEEKSNPGVLNQDLPRPPDLLGSKSQMELGEGRHNNDEALHRSKGDVSDDALRQLS